MRPTWLFGTSPSLIPKREPRLAFPRGPFAMLNIRDALGLAFFLSSFFCTYIDCRLPRVVIGDVKSNEYRSKVSELRFELQ